MPPISSSSLPTWTSLDPEQSARAIAGSALCFAVWAHEPPEGGVPICPRAHRATVFDLDAEEWRETQVLLTNVRALIDERVALTCARGLGNRCPEISATEQTFRTSSTPLRTPQAAMSPLPRVQVGPCWIQATRWPCPISARTFPGGTRAPSRMTAQVNEPSRPSFRSSGTPHWLRQTNTGVSSSPLLLEQRGVLVEVAECFLQELDRREDPQGHRDRLTGWWFDEPVLSLD
jgi:hypothetical protein